MVLKRLKREPSRRLFLLKFVLFIGKLILSVDKDTYEELGLQGRPSRYSGKKVMRYSKYDLYKQGLFKEHLVRKLKLPFHQN